MAFNPMTVFNHVCLLSGRGARSWVWSWSAQERAMGKGCRKAGFVLVLLLTEQLEFVFFFFFV